jgi:transposase
VTTADHARFSLICASAVSIHVDVAEVVRWREQRKELQERLALVTAERDAVTADRDRFRSQYEQTAEARVLALEAQVEELRGQLREALKLVDLQEADLARYKVTIEASTPHRPEHVPAKELKLVLERVLADLPDTAGANDGSSAPSGAESAADPAGAPAGASSLPGTEAPTDTCAGDEAHAPTNGTTAGPKTQAGRGRHAHGRRKLDLASLPIVVVEILPEEVRAAGGAGYERIGEEISDRLAFRPGSYVRLRLVRPTFVAISPKGEATVTEVGASTERGAEATAKVHFAPRPGSVWCAPLPGCLWPYVMADTSAIAHVIVSKYDDLLPLNRQERISMREGFVLPRSTQCGWLGASYELLYRIVDAMWEEARRTAFCIATDATGAPVRAKGACVNWHVFVMIADKDHIVFRPTREHTSDTMETMFEGFHGHLLADAAPIYDVLYREHDVIEVGCWSHARRYFWRALGSDRERAMEALAIIAELFEVAEACRDIPMPKRTRERAARAGPVLALFDRWIERHRAEVDERGPLDKAIGYYTNQREALRRFLTDGRLRLDNNISEQQVRNLVLGRANWTFFENRNGLAWYATFRSLIASCVLHGINAEQYLEEVLRLAPHWPTTRVIELAPKYWARTRASLDERQRMIVTRPWEIDAALTLAEPIVTQAA